jgi:hypothetical protein
MIRVRLGLCAAVLWACSSESTTNDSDADQGGAGGSVSAAGAELGGVPHQSAGATGFSAAAGAAGRASRGGTAGAAASAGAGSGGVGGSSLAGAGGSTGGAAGQAGSPAATAGSGGAAGAAATEPCDTSCHFIRADAAGSADGSDWTNAWTELPQTLERGHRYFIADGDYPGYTFDDPASAEDWITVQKATAESHGSEVGWSNDYGDGRARFGPLEFSAPYYSLDAVLPLGVEVVADFQGDAVAVNADWVILRNLDLNGDFATDADGTHNQGACTGLSITGAEVTVEGCEIHDVADDGVSISGSTGVSFVGNTVHALHACGTDGDCGPCYNGHSDGVETYNVKQSEFVANLIYDVRSTATFFFGNWADSLGNGPSEYCEDILLANNIFYAPEVGLVAYLQDVAGIQVFHNVFWGVRQGGYGGLSIGPNVTELQLFNNIILSINTAHTGGAFDAGEHLSDYNLYGVSLGQWTEGAHARVAADPGFVGIGDLSGPVVANPTAADFALTADSPCLGAGFTGDATVSPPRADFFGVTRGDPPDLGAVKY